MMSDYANANDALAAADFAAPATSDTPGSEPDGNDTAAAISRPDYAVAAGDNITLMASKIIRDVLVTRGRSISRGDLWRAVEMAMGDRSPDVDGVLKKDWFSNHNTGRGQWDITEAAAAGSSPFTGPGNVVNLASVVDYLRICRGEAPYIGDVGDFIKICRPGTELDAARLLQSSRALE